MMGSRRRWPTCDEGVGNPGARRDANLVDKMHVLETGHCWAMEHHVRRGAARRRIKCHALVALFQHPVQGWILFDTGYAPRFIDATRRLPESLYRTALPVEIPKGLAVVEQISRFGLRPADIRYVILSHFHGDHLAGLLDFPEARVICSQPGFQHFAARSGVRALCKAYLPSLAPSDLQERALWIDTFSDSPLPGLGMTIDLFEDASIQLVALPGHARGQIGALVNLGRRPVLLAADGCWQRESYRRQQPPHWITHLLADDVKATHRTLANLLRFHQARPDVSIIPTHCPEAHREYVGSMQQGASIGVAT